MIKKEFIDKTSYEWIHGHTDYYNDDNTFDRRIDWFKITDEFHKKAFWYIYPAYEIFSDKGMDISKENCKYLTNIFEDDWINGLYFIFNCCDGIEKFANDVAKIIINELASFAKEFNVHILNTYDAIYINKTCKAIFIEKKFDKKYFMEILNRIVCGETVDNIAKDDKFVKLDSSFLDNLIDKVIIENETKNDGSEKILNWFIGQVMKEAKGKASASEVKDKLKEKLNNN